MLQNIQQTKTHYWYKNGNNQ